MRDELRSAIRYVNIIIGIANLHITTIGHGYASYEHVDHTSRLRTIMSDSIRDKLLRNEPLTHHHGIFFWLFLPRNRSTAR